MEPLTRASSARRAGRPSMHDIGIQIPMNEILYDTGTAVLTDLPYDFVAFFRSSDGFAIRQH